MLNAINNKIMTDQQITDVIMSENGNYICYFDYDHFIANAEKLNISKEYLNDVKSNKMTGLVNWDPNSFLISLLIPHEVNAKDSFSHVFIYMRNDLLIFVCKKHKIIENLIQEIERGSMANDTIEKVLYVFFDRLLSDDDLVFETIEKKITEIEESLIYAKKQDYIKEIFTYRKKLMILKKYYQQLTDIMDELFQSDNSIIENKRYVKRLSDKSKRLYADVLHLRDYVTQIREAYQTQIDIKLNSIMKLFTIITAIFMPLTLLVGWYGMNLQMPEFSWAYGYHFVIGISVLLVIAEVIYFAKNKWL